MNGLSSTRQSKQKAIFMHDTKKKKKKLNYSPFAPLFFCFFLTTRSFLDSFLPQGIFVLVSERYAEYFFSPTLAFLVIFFSRKIKSRPTKCKLLCNLTSVVGAQQLALSKGQLRHDDSGRQSQEPACQPGQPNGKRKCPDLKCPVKEVLKVNEVLLSHMKVFKDIFSRIYIFNPDLSSCPLALRP